MSEAAAGVDRQQAARDERAVASSGIPRAARALRRMVALVLAASLCTACGGSLFESNIPVATRYVLASVPPATDPSTTAATGIDLAISRPDVAPGLDTERVAVLRGRQLDYFRGSQWGGTVTEVVQALLINSFQDQHLFRSVAAEQTRISGDYIFDVEVRDFQAEYAAGDAPPVARVTIVGRVIRLSDRQMINTMTATASKAATENRMGAVAAAFESAAQQVALELANKTAAALASDVEIRKKK